MPSAAWHTRALPVPHDFVPKAESLTQFCDALNESQPDPKVGVDVGVMVGVRVLVGVRVGVEVGVAVFGNN